MFHLIGFILFGLIVGLLARLLMPGKEHMSLVMTGILGIAGALLAGFLGRLVHWYGPNDRAGFITSTLGALLVLYLYNRFVVARDHRHGQLHPADATRELRGDRFTHRPA